MNTNLFKKQTIGIIIPIYNDWESLKKLVLLINDSISNLNWDFNIYIVDDNSTLTSSYEDLFPSANIRTAIKKIEIIKLIRNVGHQSAIAISLSHIASMENLDALLLMDGDGEDKPQDIPRLLVEFQNNNNSAVIFAKRGKRHESVSFRVSYKTFQLINYLLTGIRVDFGNFSIIPLRVAKEIILYPELWTHYPATIIKSKAHTVKVDCEKGHRLDGKSQMSFLALVLHGLGCISVFSSKVGVRMLILMFVLIMLLTILITTIALIKFLTTLAIPGWATFTIGILGILLFQASTLALFFIFLILNNSISQVSLPIIHFKTFIDFTKVIFQAK